MTVQLLGIAYEYRRECTTLLYSQLLDVHP